MDIAGTLSAVSAALGVVKELKSIESQLDQATLKLKIAELTSALADAKLGMIDVSEDMRSKDAEITELKSKLKYRAESLIDHNSYRYEAKDGASRRRPLLPYLRSKRNVPENGARHGSNRSPV